jgi:transcriptional regulator with XRE-family HTH domain
MRSFKNIANLVRTKRINHTKNYSQSELSAVLGYKNGQFISNVERGLCSLPPKMMKKISEVLEISPDEIKTAILKDYEVTLNKFFQIETKVTIVEADSKVA